MLIPHKREFLARRLGDLGVIRLLESVARWASVLVVTYHRIGEPALGEFYDGVYAATPEAFRTQVTHLRDRFQVIGLDELEALADSGFAVERPTVLITFDDGYRDNFEVAFPILQQLGVPATFFIPTKFFEVSQLPWWDHTAYVIKRSERKQIALDWPEAVVIDLPRGPRTSAIMAVIRLYLDGKILDEAQFRAHLEERASVVVDEEALGRSLLMSWDQVRRLSTSGMAIGAHSHSHHRLSALSEADQRFELLESKRILERELGREVKALAYPFGWSDTYDERTKRQAREAGYRLAFSSKEGVNRPGASDPWELHRLGVGITDSPPLLRARVAFQSAFGASFL
jgi:peptidoglycan/xylan/chitin deacetylase (PgdA/CDA1 family)